MQRMLGVMVVIIRILIRVEQIVCVLGIFVVLEPRKLVL